MTTFFVPGDPAPQGSKSYKGKRNGKPVLVESSKSLPGWRRQIARTAGLHARVLDGPIDVDLQFVMHRPQRLPKTQPTPPRTQRPDLDKLVRAVFDALTDVAWLDDSQVVDLRARKRTAEVGEQVGVLISYRPSVAAAEVDEMWAAA